ncbi:23802_t:CDS:1, partial [Racocetra persica]
LIDHESFLVSSLLERCYSNRSWIIVTGIAVLKSSLQASFLDRS